MADNGYLIIDERPGNLPVGSAGGRNVMMASRVVEHVNLVACSDDAARNIAAASASSEQRTGSRLTF